MVISAIHMRGPDPSIGKTKSSRIDSPPLSEPSSAVSSSFPRRLYGTGGGDEQLPEEYPYDEDPDIYKLFVQPKYIKVSHKSKPKTSILKRLFLAQELDTTKPSQSLRTSISSSTPSSGGGVSSSGSKYKSGGSTSTGSSRSSRSSLSTANAGNHNTNPSKAHRRTGSGSSVDDGDALWCLKFSPDGKYLAAAGKDPVIRIYKVISSPLDRLKYEHEHANDDLKQSTPTKSKRNSNDAANLTSPKLESRFSSSSNASNNTNSNSANKKPSFCTGSNSNSGSLYAPLFHDEPFKEFVGHSHDILSLDWSKNNFLLSSSMDRTVRLWHVDRNECLQVYEHSDFVTCAKFHPADDRFFVSGSLDKKVRLWSILDKNISYQSEVSHMITACEFYPKGDYVIVGTINGMVFAFETRGLLSKFSFDLKKGYISNSSNAKISGLQCFEEPLEDGSSEVRALVTTNDSRVRLYSCTHKKLLVKFKGLQNKSSQATAVISNNHKIVLSGSEDQMIYLWDVNDPEVLESAKKSKGIHLFKNHKSTSTPVKLGDPDLPENVKNDNFYSFHGHSSCVTSAVFVPERAKNLLYLSNDPIYDLNRTFEEILASSSSKSSPNKNTETLLRRVTSGKSLDSQDPSNSSAEYVGKNLNFFNETCSKRGSDLISHLKNSNFDPDSIFTLIDPLKFPIIVSGDKKGKIRVFRVDSASSIRNLLQEELCPSRWKKCHRHHHHHELGKLNLEPFLKKLEGYQSYLISHRMTNLSIDEEGKVGKCGTRSKSRRTKYRRLKKQKKVYDDGLPSPTSSNDLRAEISQDAMLPHDIIDGGGDIEVQVELPHRSFLGLRNLSRSSFAHPKSVDETIGNDALEANKSFATIKGLAAEQPHGGVYPDIKNDRFMPPLKKNGSLYSLSNGSISSLLRGRSGSKDRSDESSKPRQQVCDVCDGTKISYRKAQYKGSSDVVKVCQDCGNQLTM
ncbi:Laf1 protein [Saccharomycopsis crataegensis]|uniref:Laf1 protein n=1 Tax=Saccharomycopsis crataegensis TaxID=43959 RepID=A0AAV5QVF1_9ASCO|nr:Laf1 protein [Saccharomycopsis crataegensis]